MFKKEPPAPTIDWLAHTSLDDVPPLPALRAASTAACATWVRLLDERVTGLEQLHAGNLRSHEAFQLRDRLAVLEREAANAADVSNDACAELAAAVVKVRADFAAWVHSTTGAFYNLDGVDWLTYTFTVKRSVRLKLDAWA